MFKSSFDLPSFIPHYSSHFSLPVRAQEQTRIPIGDEMIVEHLQVHNFLQIACQSAILVVITGLGLFAEF